MADIVLATLNAKWIHAAFGLRSLRANLGELRERSVVREFEISQRPVDVVEALLADRPRLLGLRVYIWNALPMLSPMTTQAMRCLPMSRNGSSSR